MLNIQGRDRTSEATVVVGATMIRLLATLGTEIKRTHAKLLKICRITLQDRIFTIGLESRHATVRSHIQGLSEARIMGEWKALYHL